MYMIYRNILMRYLIQIEQNRIEYQGTSVDVKLNRKEHSNVVRVNRIEQLRKYVNVLVNKE